MIEKAMIDYDDRRGTGGERWGKKKKREKKRERGRREEQNLIHSLLQELVTKRGLGPLLNVCVDRFLLLVSTFRFFVFALA